MRDAALRPALQRRRDAGAPRPRLAAQGQRVPLRGQAGQPLRAARRAEEADVLVFGHTHKPWVHEFGGVLFVNCGSVGKPKDGDPRGAFALLDADATTASASRSSASTTTPPRSRARSPRPGCRASSPTSSSSRPEPWTARSPSGAAPAPRRCRLRARVRRLRRGRDRRALRRRARRGGHQPGLRADHHGHDLRDRPPLRRAHQPRGHDRVHRSRDTSRPATPSAYIAAPGRRGDRRRARAARRLDRQAGQPRRDGADRRRRQRAASTSSCSPRC